MAGCEGGGVGVKASKVNFFIVLHHTIQNFQKCNHQSCGLVMGLKVKIKLSHHPTPKSTLTPQHFKITGWMT